MVEGGVFVKVRGEEREAEGSGDVVDDKEAVRAAASGVVEVGLSVRGTSRGGMRGRTAFSDLVTGIGD